MILDGGRLAEQMFGERIDPREHLIRMYPAVEERVPPLDHVVLTAPPLVARINHGIWIASCSCGARGVPTPGCIVDLDVRLGLCARCGNQGWGGGWRPVVVPPEGERHLIEAVLLCRPNVEDRNWEPGETVEDLVAQNREHGDPVPEIRPEVAGPLHGPDWRDMAPFGGRLRSSLGRRWWQRLLPGRG